MKDHYIPENHFPMTLSPGVTMLGNYFFNLFLVRGEKRSALFETGISGICDPVISQLEHLGVAPDYLIPSHPHSDHITGLPGLAQRFPKARLLTGAGAKKFLTHPKAEAPLVKEDRFMSQRLENLGIRPGRPSLEKIPDLTPAKEIGTTTQLDLGGVTLELIPVPGHSPGNLLGNVKEEKILFCSDSLGFHFPGRGFWPLFFTGAAPYLSTLERISHLSPEMVCPAHQGPLKGPAAEKAIKDSLQITHEIIHRINTTQLKDNDLATELFTESYKDEFTLYTENNIQNCSRLMIKRAREYNP